MSVGPEGFATSTRVVTSNVRHSPVGTPSANRRLVPGNARLADTAPAARRKSRRFMVPPLGADKLSETNPYFTPPVVIPLMK
jgi:hypothetical protein